MKDIIQKIQDASHIVVLSSKDSDFDSLGSASAFYTYLLTIHKKVSFFCEDKELENSLSVIPWFEKIRSSFQSSSDLAITFCEKDLEKYNEVVECELINIKGDSLAKSQTIYNFFKDNDMKINNKMALSLYSGLIYSTNCFSNKGVDGTIFATARELLACGINHDECVENIIKNKSLSLIRQKALMLKDMQLFNNATEARFYIDDLMLESSGASLKECKEISKEAFLIKSVKKISLIYKDIEIEKQAR